MSTVEVKVATNIRASGPNWTTLYTVPAGKQAIVRTVTAANTAQASASLAARLGLRRSGTVTRLSNTAISNAASANLLPAAMTMVAGDELVTTETAGDTFGEIVATTFPDSLGSSSTPGVAIVDSNTIICCSANGIFRSADAGATFTQVSSLACTTKICSAKIGTDYFIYQSTTSAYRSTNGGLTWTTQAVTNAPNFAGDIGLRVSAPGRIVFNGTVYGGLTTTTQLSTTTNGITWTNVAAAFPASVDCLVWSGTHWVAGRDNTSSQIYRSTDGASWSTVTARTDNSGQGINGLATNGAGVIITGNSSGTAIGRSADHGATWSDQTVPFTLSAASGNSAVNYFGSNFFLFTNTTNVTNYSPTGLTGSFVITNALSTFSADASDSYGVNATNVFYTNTGLRKFTLTIPTAFAGMDVSAAILEVTP
jgi:hypothetical protein